MKNDLPVSCNQLFFSVFQCKIKLALLMACFVNLAFSQENDSLIHVHGVEVGKAVVHIDSVMHVFQTKSDSITVLFQREWTTIDSTRNKLRLTLDSLRNLSIPTDRIMMKLDSLEQLASRQLSRANNALEEIKAKTIYSLDNISLPEPMSESLKTIRQNIQGIKLPTGEIESMSWIEGKSIDLPDWRLGEIKNSIDLKSLDQLSEKAGSTSSQTKLFISQKQDLVNDHLDAVKHADETITQKLVEMEGMEQLKAGSELYTSLLPVDSAALVESVTKVAKDQVIKLAKNHFAGKEEVLRQAISKLGELKRKYPDAQSLDDIPGKKKSSLSQVPIRNRLEPTLTFQCHKSTYLWLDINPGLMYRISQRIYAGAGWNQRIYLGARQPKLIGEVYGPRLAFEYRWNKGVILKVIPECMNAPVPKLKVQQMGVDYPVRTWVESLSIGVKKEFTITKRLKGNTEVLYTIYDPKGMSPYADKLIFRFGFALHPGDQKSR